MSNTVPVAKDPSIKGRDYAKEIVDLVYDEVLDHIDYDKQKSAMTTEAYERLKEDVAQRIIEWSNDQERIADIPFESIASVPGRVEELREKLK